MRDTLGDLVGQGYDAAVRFGEPEPSGLIAEKLLETRIITCAVPSYLARHGTPRHPSDLVHHACLMFRDPTAGLPSASPLRSGEEWSSPSSFQGYRRAHEQVMSARK